MSAWLRDQNLLELLAKTASGNTEQPTETPPPWLRLQRRETVIWSGSGAQLVEATTNLELPGQDTAYTELTLPQLLGPFPGKPPAEVRSIDTGTAVITTIRVVFAGARHRREWSYARVKGLAHLAGTPITLFRLASPKLYGLLPPEPIAVEFRFLLGLALADRAKARKPLAGRLDRLLTEHRKARPEPPSEPQRGRIPALLAIMAVAAAICAVVAFTWVRTQSTPVAIVDPVTATTAAVAGPPEAQPPRRTSTPTTQPTEPTTSSTTTSLCGAPANPYGYNFCGGALVHDPDPQVCDYFTCIWDFPSGRGYLVQCSDGMVSLWGGLSGACGDHGGIRQRIYG